MSAPAPRIHIWDRPTRLFHWLIVLLIPALWWTAEYGRIELHRTLGLVMLGLVLFRLIWGVIGASTARFSSFLKGPRGVVSYLSGRTVHVLGHNPLGGWSVIAMLAVLATQVGLGLFATDEDGIVTGPLAHLVSIDTSETLTERHETMFNILLVLIGVHLAAILFYALVKRRNLVGPMLTGSGTAPEGTEPAVTAPAWRFLVAAAIAASAAFAVAQLG